MSDQPEDRLAPISIILANNRQVNPLGVKLPTGVKLKGRRLAAFNVKIQEIAALRDGIPLPAEVASDQ